MLRGTVVVWVAAGMVYVVSGPAKGEQIQLPGYPAYPTSHEQCSAPSRAWQEISRNINRQHSACLDSQACKRSNRNHRGQCTCGACEGLHALMTRFSAGDLAQYKREQEKLCRQKVLAHEREEANRRAAYAENQRRATVAQEEAQRRWHQQQQEYQRRHHEAMQEQQRQQAIQRQQALAMQRHLEQAQADRAAAAERAVSALNNLLADDRTPLPPGPHVPDSSPPLPVHPSSTLGNEPARSPDAALRELESINTALANAAPTAAPTPSRGVQAALEQAKSRYEDLMERSFQIGDVKMRVNELKDTLISITETYLSELDIRSVRGALGHGIGRVQTNPVLELAGPFLDPENARNIDAAVRGARRQAETGTMNEVSARQMRDAMDELERQAGRDPGAERAARCQRLATTARRCKEESLAGDSGQAFSECYNHYMKAWQASCR